MQRFNLTTIDEIKAAVDAGYKVHSSNDGYEVRKSKGGDYYIIYTPNDYMIGLHGQAGTEYAEQLNGSDFYYYTDDPFTYEVQKFLGKSRTDIDYMHFDSAYPETWTDNLWSVPVEAFFNGSEVDFAADAGWYHGTLDVEFDEYGNVVDYSVGNWEYGFDPNQHTFER